MTEYVDREKIRPPPLFDAEMKKELQRTKKFLKEMNQ